MVIALVKSRVARVRGVSRQNLKIPKKVPIFVEVALDLILPRATSRHVIDETPFLAIVCIVVRLLEYRDFSKYLKSFEYYLFNNFVSHFRGDFWNLADDLNAIIVDAVHVIIGVLHIQHPLT